MARRNNDLLALWSDSRIEHLDQHVSEVAVTHLPSRLDLWGLPSRSKGGQLYKRSLLCKHTGPPEGILGRVPPCMT